MRAAAERFRTHGFAGTSLDELADATGLNRPSLYAAFGDKRALYLAALAALHDKLERSFDALAAADLPLPDLLARIFGWTIDRSLTGETAPSGCLMIGTAITESTRDPDVRAAVQRFIAMEDARTIDLLAAAGHRQAEAAGRLVMSLVHSITVRARAGATREELELLAQDAIALFGNVR